MVDITALNLFQWCKCLKHTGKLMILVVLGIIGLAGYAVFDAFLTPGLRSTNPAAVVGYALLSTIYTAVLVFIFWSYWVTFITDPGQVPPGWHPFGSNLTAIREVDALETMIRQHQEASLDRGRAYLERPRFCKKCQCWKPPRAHHCSMLGRCVLKMDHYCVWVANTVGLLNYKSFVLFLGYAFVGCLMSAAMLVKPCVSFFHNPEPPVDSILVSFLAFVFTGAFSLALLGFLVMHLRLIAMNQTTIEAYEKRPVKPWPYDRGPKRNYQDVFGKDRKRWFLPTLTPEEASSALSSYLDFNILQRYNLDVEAGGSLPLTTAAAAEIEDRSSYSPNGAPTVGSPSNNNAINGDIRTNKSPTNTVHVSNNGLFNGLNNHFRVSRALSVDDMGSSVDDRSTSSAQSYDAQHLA